MTAAAMTTPTCPELTANAAAVAAAAADSVWFVLAAVAVASIAAGLLAWALHAIDIRRYARRIDADRAAALARAANADAGIAADTD